MIHQKHLRDFIAEWNLQYPYDRYWRKKYNVAFGSKQHREMDFLSMAVDLLEDKMFAEIEEKEADLSDLDFYDSVVDSERNDQTKKSQIIKQTKKEIDEDFDNLDLNEYNG